MVCCIFFRQKLTRKFQEEEHESGSPSRLDKALSVIGLYCITGTTSRHQPKEKESTRKNSFCPEENQHNTQDSPHSSSEPAMATLQSLFDEVVAGQQDPTNTKILKRTLIKVNYLQLRATEEATTPEGVIFLAKVLLEKKKLKSKLTSLSQQTEQNNFAVISKQNKDLKRELRTLKKQNKVLEEENIELKDQIDLLDAFREEAEHSSSSVSSSEDDVTTFKVAVKQEPEESILPSCIEPEEESSIPQGLTPIFSNNNRSRRQSRLVIESAPANQNTQIPPIATVPSKREGKKPKRTSKTVKTNPNTPRKKTITDETIPHLEPTSIKSPRKDSASSLHLEPNVRSPRKDSHGTYVLSNSSPANLYPNSPSPLGESNPDLSPEGEEKPSENVFDENTVGDIITGLITTVKERNWSDDMLVPKDYLYWYQFKIKRKGQPLLKFKDFAPKVFSVIRKFYGIDDETFLKAFSADNLKVVPGEGKSGAFFIFTKDKQFILKTCLDTERDFLWEVLPYYWQYTFTNRNTLLPRFYGIYSMKHEGIGGMTRFVIMNNVFNTNLEMNLKFDLKGSTLGRFVPLKDRKPGVILKDQDIKDMGRKLHLSPLHRQEFIKMVKKDSDFLSRYKVMDYSLLLGIAIEEPPDAATIQKSSASTKTPTKLGPRPSHDDQQALFCGKDICVLRPDGVTEHYFFGIIDILIQYGGRKKAESLLKAVVYSEEASVVPPDRYAERFQEFMFSLLPEATKSEDEVSDDSSENCSTHTVTTPRETLGYSPPKDSSSTSKRKITAS